MKKLLIGLYLSLMITNSCVEQNEQISLGGYQNEGIINEPDLRMCPCCGGWFIYIESVKYRFFTLPDNSGINFEKETLPLKVLLDWKKSDNLCNGDEIIITRIKKV
jgi:hypothetical protein